MKKRRISCFLIVLFLLLWPVTAQASGTTYGYQLSGAAWEMYQTMTQYLPAGYDSFSHAFSQPLVYDSADAANTEMQNLAARAYDAFYRDYPEVFWLDKSGFSLSCQYQSDGETVSITGFSLQVQFSTTSIGEKQAALDQAVNSIVQSASGTDYDKLRWFHDAILARCTYNQSAVSVYDPMSCEAYGALVEGSAICEGYAKAFKLLCDRAGIPCEIIGGTANGEAHMWNDVYLDGAYYLVDTTFDDALGSYDYFLKGSASAAGYQEGASLLDGFSTGLYSPTLSDSDYQPGAAASAVVPAESELPSSNEATSQESSSPVDSAPEEAPQSSAPEEEDPLCTVFPYFSKNGRYWVAQAGNCGFFQGRQTVSPGTDLQIIACPDPGYRVAAIQWISASGTTETISQRAQASYCVEQDGAIQVLFQPVD